MRLTKNDIKHLPQKYKEQLITQDAIADAPQCSWPSSEPHVLLYQLLVSQYGCAVYGGGDIVNELVLYPKEKRYRFDAAHLSSRILFEVNGWQYHHQLESFRRDHHKNTYALTRGWVVMKIMAKDINQNPLELQANIAKVVSQRHFPQQSIRPWGKCFYQLAISP